MCNCVEYTDIQRTMSLLLIACCITCCCITLQQKRKATIALSGVLLAIAAGLPGGTKWSVTCAIGALTAAASSYKLKQYEQLFTFVDYVHGKRDV
jgi:hypothetical protein